MPSNAKHTRCVQGTSDAVASRAESLDAFKSAIVSALAFHNCVDATEAANAAVDLLEDSYDAHPSLVSLLLLPTALGLGEAADGQVCTKTCLLPLLAAVLQALYSL